MATLSNCQLAICYIYAQRHAISGSSSLRCDITAGLFSLWVTEGALSRRLVSPSSAPFNYPLIQQKPPRSGIVEHEDDVARKASDSFEFIDSLTAHVAIHIQLAVAMCAAVCLRRPACWSTIQRQAQGEPVIVPVRALTYVSARRP